MKINSIIYDFDGVLAESVSVKDSAFISIFKEYGDKFASDMLSYHKAMNTDRHLTIQEAAKRLNINSNDFISNKTNEFASHVFQGVISSKEVNGTTDLLRYCASSGIRQFVSSGAPEDELKKIIEARRIDCYFDCICGIPRRKTQHIDDLKERYKLDLDKTVFIGDTMLDYQSAHARNIIFIARSSSFIFPVSCRIVEDMKDLFNMLKSDIDLEDLRTELYSRR